MRWMNPLITQLRHSYGVLALAMAVSLSLLLAVLALHTWKQVPIASLTRDPVSVMGASFYTGFFSQAGIFFWVAAAAICLFTWRVLGKRGEGPESQSFLMCSGLLTLLLAVDDVFLIHDLVMPHFGLPEQLAYMSYLGLILLYLIRFHRLILRTEYSSTSSTCCPR